MKRRILRNGVLPSQALPQVVSAQVKREREAEVKKIRYSLLQQSLVRCCCIPLVVAPPLNLLVFLFRYCIAL